LARENRERRLTLSAFALDRFDVVNLGVVVTEEFVCLLDTLGTIYSLLVRRIVLETLATPLTLRLFFGIFPVPVVFTGFWITFLTEALPCLRIVELGVTTLAGSVRKRVAVYLRVVLTHPLFGR
jgi:hypothetical protein